MSLTVFAAEVNIDIICVLEHSYYHTEQELNYYGHNNGWIFVSPSTWQNSFNAAIGGGVGIFLSSFDLKSLNSIEKIQKKMTCATFNCNLYTTVVSCYNSTIEETHITTFFYKLSSFSSTFSNNVFIISRNMNAHSECKSKIRNIMV